MSNLHRPGEFRTDVPSDAVNVSKEADRHSFEPHANETLAADYRLLTTQMEEQPKKILYPCCESDVTPSAAFPNTEVQYVDMNQQAMEALMARGFDAHYGHVPAGRQEGKSSSDFSEAPLFILKGQVDLLILLNPQISPFAIVQYVRERGYVLCNNYHRTADEMHTCSDFAPAAVLHTAEGKSLDTTSLGEYFQLMTTDEEYKRADPEKYKAVQRYVYGKIRTLFPRLFDVSHAVPQFLKDAEGKREMFGTITIGKYELPKPLRKKQSGADDLFLFQKR